MRFVRVVGLSILIAISGAHGVTADEGWESFRAGMGEYDDTLSVSERFASLLSDGDDEGLSKLADDVRQHLDDRYLRLVYEGYGLEPEPGQSETERFDAAVAHVTALGVFADGQATRSAMESLGTCQTAGVLVRNLVLQAVDGKKRHRVENGRIFIDGTSNDQRYATALARCQTVGRHKPTPAAVGYSQIACQASNQHDCPDIVDR